MELLASNQIETQKVVKKWLDEAAEDQRKVDL